MTEAVGPEARDSLWDQPDLVPTAADIDDPSRAIARLQGRGAEAVILGCTEIGMLIDDSVSPVPTYDTTELHAKALVQAALA